MNVNVTCVIRNKINSRRFSEDFVSHLTYIFVMTLLLKNSQMIIKTTRFPLHYLAKRTKVVTSSFPKAVSKLKYKSLDLSYYSNIRLISTRSCRCSKSISDKDDDVTKSDSGIVKSERPVIGGKCQ